MTAGPTVDILLPTYNGSAYIDELIQSITRQSYSRWRLLVRDDASDDDTYDRLQFWADALPLGLIRFVDSGAFRQRIGSTQSFSRLLAESDSPYVMLCDQDDVWYPFKIEKTLQAMQDLEDTHGDNHPCLVCTDVHVVDSQLTVLTRSYWAAQSIHPSRHPWFSRYLLENTAQGCTLMINRSLVSIAGDIPDASVYADWWLALVASAFGTIQALGSASLMWRRHGQNLSSTSDVIQVATRTLIQPSFAHERISSVYREARTRAAAFSQRFGASLSSRDKAALDAFIEIGEVGFFRKRLLLARHRILFTSIRRCLGLFIFI